MLEGTTSRGRTNERRARGQAVVELALMGMFLWLLLAAAVDLGRAFYIASVVANMAGEGAAYAATNPELDQLDGSCTINIVTNSTSIQERARRVAKAHGLVISSTDQSNAVITITPNTCYQRCAGTTITVQVAYTVNDLFLPGILGMNNIVIRQTASQTVLRDPLLADNCH